MKLEKYLLKFVTQPMFGRFTLKESDVIVNFKFQKPKYLRSVPTSITDFRETKIFYFAKINFIYIVKYESIYLSFKKTFIALKTLTPCTCLNCNVFKKATLP